MITPKETIQFVEEYSYFYSSENKYNEKGREIKQYIATNNPIINTMSNILKLDFTPRTLDSL